MSEYIHVSPMSTDLASGQLIIDPSDSNITVLAQSLQDYLALIKDHRSKRTLLHKLSDELFRVRQRSHQQSLP